MRPVEIFKPINQESFQLCHPIDSSDYEKIADEIDGTVRQATWRSIRMKLINEDEGEHLFASDSPWLGSWALIFSRRAVEAVGSMLRSHGELLPLECAEADLVIYNPTRVVDAL